MDLEMLQNFFPFLSLNHFSFTVSFVSNFTPIMSLKIHRMHPQTLSSYSKISKCDDLINFSEESLGLKTLQQKSFFDFFYIVPFCDAAVKDISLIRS